MDINRAPSPGGEKPDRRINLRLLILQYTFPDRVWLLCMKENCSRIIVESEEDFQAWLSEQKIFKNSLVNN